MIRKENGIERGKRIVGHITANPAVVIVMWLFVQAIEIHIAIWVQTVLLRWIEFRNIGPRNSGHTLQGTGSPSVCQQLLSTRLCPEGEAVKGGGWRFAGASRALRVVRPQRPHQPLHLPLELRVVERREVGGEAGAQVRCEAVLPGPPERAGRSGPGHLRM